MSYSEYTWQTGETITAEKLNNLEGGVQEALANGSGSPLVLEVVPIIRDSHESTEVYIHIHEKDVSMETILSDATLQELMSAWIRTNFQGMTVMVSVFNIIPVSVEPSSTQSGLCLKSPTNGYQIMGLSPVMNTIGILVLPTNADIVGFGTK